MQRIVDTESLAQLAAQGRRSMYATQPKLLVGMATCGRAAGAEEIYGALDRTITEHGYEVLLTRTGCIGFCQQEPLVDVILAQGPRIVFPRVKVAQAVELLKDAANGEVKTEKALAYIPQPVEDLKRIEISQERFNGLPHITDLPFYSKQNRIALRNCGLLDPESVAEYASRGGFRSLLTVLRQMSPKDVVTAITDSALRGRGGAGFLTGRKWDLCRCQPGEEKYVICNADEGDPGAFMDRSIMEGDPYSVLEGMIIGAYAIGAQQGYMYVRGEYPLAVSTLSLALEQCRSSGLLGKNIVGTGFDFDIEIVRGAGAFVCGEETGLIASIQGEIGSPRQRPPYPAQSGLWGKPTNINNVETWANVPAIIQRGAAWFAEIGTDKSKGTKVFSLVGKVKNTGLVEVAMGTTLRDIVYDIGGGIKKDRAFKAVQTGGPSGGCIPEEFLDIPVDFDRLIEAGAMMGSGGLIVMDERTCMVDVAKYFLHFLVEESCGKCTPCREGVHQMHAILSRISEGNGSADDISLLEELGEYVKEASLCQLGGTAPNPVLSTLRCFRDEYEAHVYQKKCPAGVCKSLVRFSIDAELCEGCGLCIRECPAQAISGEKKQAHIISSAECTTCGVCYEICPFDAVRAA